MTWAQLWTQGRSRRADDCCSRAVSRLILFLALKYTIGIRPSVEVELEGLDINEHGERAYNY
jgi:Amt family ammonium transporter